MSKKAELAKRLDIVPLMPQVIEVKYFCCINEVHVLACCGKDRALHRCVYIYSLTYGHEMWIMTKIIFRMWLEKTFCQLSNYHLETSVQTHPSATAKIAF